MVEYALLLAGGGLRSLATIASNWVSGLDSNVIWFAGLALIALRVAFWAFNSRRPH